MSTTALGLLLLLAVGAIPLGAPGAAMKVCAAGSRESFRLVDKFDAAPDTKLLRFELPGKILRMPPHTLDGTYLAPTGVSCVANLTTNPDGELKKSYSPVSLPDADHLELYVFTKHHSAYYIHSTLSIAYTIHITYYI